MGAARQYSLTPWQDWTGWGDYEKLGGMCWFEIGVFFGIPYAIPEIGWGGSNLGLWGI